MNGAPSTDPVSGWGRPGGYVFQKVNSADWLSLNELKVYHEPNFFVTNIDVGEGERGEMVQQF